MPIRLLFLLLFLPSTFLSSLNVYHVDALVLYEPHLIRWTGHMFQSSSQRAAFLKFLSGNIPTASELTKENLSTLSILWDAFRQTTIEEGQTNPASQMTFSAPLHPAKKLYKPSTQLKRRHVASPPKNSLHSRADSATENRTNRFRDVDPANNLREAVPLRSLQDASPENSVSESTDKELTDPGFPGPNISAKPTETPTGKPSTAGPPKAPPKAQAQKAPRTLLEDAGLKGLIIVSTVAFIIGIYLLLTKRHAAQPESEIPVGSENKSLGEPPNTLNYTGDADISGPMGNSTTQLTREAKPVYISPQKVENNKIPVARPSVRSATANPVSLPSNVKVAKQRTRIPSPNKGKEGQLQRPSPKPRG